MDRSVNNTERGQPDGIFLALAGLAAGIILAYNGVSLPFLVFIPVLLSLLCIRFDRRLLFFTSFMLVSGLITFHHVAIPENHIAKAEIKKITGLSGKILRCRETSFDTKYTIMADGYVMEDKTVHKSSGKVLLTAGRADVFPAGSFISARDVSLHEIEPPKNPGEEDFRPIMRRQSIFLHGRAGEVMMSAPSINRAVTFFSRIRKRLSRLLDRRFAYFPEERALLETMTVGRENVPYFLREAGKRSGTYHLLVISGLHLAFLILFLRILFIPLRNFNNRHLKFFPSLALLVLWFYAGVTGFRIPVVRAALMLSFFFLAEIFEREIKGLQSISLAAVLLLLVNPLNLFDVSFQLSFAATAGILFFMRRYGSIVKRGFIPGLLVTCLGAQVSVLPLLIYHFGIFYPVGLINNIFFMPLAGLIMLSFPLFLIFPFLFVPLRMFLSLFLYLATFSSQVTRGVELNFTLPVLFAAYLFLFLFFSRMEIRKRLFSCSLVTLAAAGIIFFPLLYRQNGEDRLYILSMNRPAAVFINGRETAAFFPDNCRQRNMKRVLMPFFSEKRISKLSGLFYTGISYNHTGTLEAVREKLRVERIFEHEAVKKISFYPYLSIYFYNNGDYSFSLRKTGDRTVVSGLQVEFLGEENGKLAYSVRKGDVRILVAPYLGQEIAEKIENHRFDVAWISDMKNTVKVKRLVETAQFDYLVLPKDLKKFKDLKSSVKTFYLGESAVIADFSVWPPAVSYYKDTLFSPNAESANSLWRRGEALPGKPATSLRRTLKGAPHGINGYQFAMIW